jgi:hypothetical protein
MHHRFQLNSAAQSIGGANYRNAVRGDGQTPFTIIDGDEQRDALNTVLSTLSVDFLKLPENVLDLLPPAAYRHTQGESFPGRAGLLFDALGAAEASANLSVQQLMHPARMARLVTYGSMGDYPDLEEVVDSLIEHTWGAETPEDEYGQRVLSVVQRVAVDEMITQASNTESSGDVRSVLASRLNELANQLEEERNPSAHQEGVAADIRRWQQRAENALPEPALQMPAGDPI